MSCSMKKPGVAAEDRPTYISFYEGQARSLSGELVSMSDYAGKVVLIENTASLWGTTSRDFLQMNELCEKFPGQLAVLAFPSNQFGHQENSDGVEILNALQNVRPGDGFVPKAEMFDKVEVNGENENPLFTFLKKSLPEPTDAKGVILGNPRFITWSPVKRSDIAWNFEKFLIRPDGTPFKRYSRYFLTSDIEEDIKGLMDVL